MLRKRSGEGGPMAQQGASVRITFDGGIPTSEVIILDIQWDTDDLSAGKWWGQLALFGATGSTEGEWQWDPSAGMLNLFANPLPGGAIPILVARLNDFVLPTISGKQGAGRLADGLVPAAPPTFVWVTP